LNIDIELDIFIARLYTYLTCLIRIIYKSKTFIISDKKYNSKIYRDA